MNRYEDYTDHHDWTASKSIRSFHLKTQEYQIFTRIPQTKRLRWKIGVQMNKSQVDYRFRMSCSDARLTSGYYSCWGSGNYSKKETRIGVNIAPEFMIIKKLQFAIIPEFRLEKSFAQPIQGNYSTTKSWNGWHGIYDSTEVENYTTAEVMTYFEDKFIPSLHLKTQLGYRIKSHTVHCHVGYLLSPSRVKWVGHHHRILTFGGSYSYTLKKKTPNNSSSTSFHMDR